MGKNKIRWIFEHEAALSFQKLFVTELSNGIGYFM